MNITEEINHEILCRLFCFHCQLCPRQKCALWYTEILSYHKVSMNYEIVSLQEIIIILLYLQKQKPSYLAT